MAAGVLAVVVAVKSAPLPKTCIMVWLIATVTPLGETVGLLSVTEYPANPLTGVAKTVAFATLAEPCGTIIVLGFVPIVESDTIIDRLRVASNRSMLPVVAS